MIATLLLASLVTLGGVHWAAQPADEKHRFGQDAAETLRSVQRDVTVYTL